MKTDQKAPIQKTTCEVRLRVNFFDYQGEGLIFSDSSRRGEKKHRRSPVIHRTLQDGDNKALTVGTGLPNAKNIAEGFGFS